MKYNKKGNVVYYTSKLLDVYGIKHCYSTKHGGISTGQYKSMNLGRCNGDIAENVDKNYDLICEAVGLNRNMLLGCTQTHSNNVKVVTSDDIGKSIPNNDGLVTNEKGLVLVTAHADCVPVFFYDRAKEVVALVHSGWKGTLENISKNTIELMKNDFDCKTNDIIVCVGASICYNCFEVENDVLNMFLDKYDVSIDYYKEKESLDCNQKYLIDLKKIIKYQLLEEGVLDNNIEVTDVCTMCTEDMFFSHRKHGTKRGSQMAFIQI